MPLLIALLAFAAHVATSYRYGYFRDELYFIACGRHLAWGYVDQPPLVAVAAWIASPVAENLVALRILPVVAAALAVWVAARIARELGGGAFAQSFAALATFLVPAYLLLGNTLTTTSFEPLSWTLLAYFGIRLIRTRDPRFWIAIAAAFVFGFYGKYSMLLFAFALLVGLVLTRERRLLATWWFAAAAVLAIIAVSPNVLWQAMHGWPFVQVIGGDFEHRHAFQNGFQLEYRNFARNAAAFLSEQVLYTNPITVPLWAGGLAALAFARRYAAFRSLAISYVILLAAAIWLEGKGYYIIGVYALLIAAGCVELERLAARTTARAFCIVLFLAATLPFVPLSLPVLPVNTFIAYSRVLRLTGQNGTPPHLMQPLYAEEFGWRELARHVAIVYDSLPPAIRLRTGLFADTYGDAGALSFYGPRYGLPPVISAQNTYYLWGTHGYSGKTLIVVGASEAAIVQSVYRHVRLVATYGNPYKWVVEGPTPIYLCTDPVAPLSQLWPRFKWYGA